ncbi:hypothetical protein C0995_000180 [Termitomyces sp. Mi166|nr:hypothetical protein C0995_000180 [Termitomyces sp. Mi166\
MLLLLLACLGLLAAVLAAVLPFVRLLVRQRVSPLRRLSGPPCPSLLMGNLREMDNQENTNLLATWEEKYGPTYVYHGFLAGPRLITTDPTALAHVLAHAYDYPKPDFVRDSLASMGAGYHGILTAEGDTHRRQRRILSPAFSKPHLATLAPVFAEKATQLRDLWLAQVDAHPSPPRIDVLAPSARATLDVIGEAGFGYHFNALSSSADQLAAAFAVIFSASRKFRMFTILQAWFPILRHFRPNATAESQAHETMHRIGTALIDQKRAEILSESTTESTRRPRDLLSLLIRSNLCTSLKSQEAGLSTLEVRSQISTFITAGHETSASALTWSLYALATSPQVQAKLRDALRSLSEIEGCEYLDWVVRESLRLHAPVTSTMRVCRKPGGDLVPLEVPVRGSRVGETVPAVRVQEGDILTIPIQAVNRSVRLWGPDAGVFRPAPGRPSDPGAAERDIDVLEWERDAWEGE